MILWITVQGPLILELIPLKFVRNNKRKQLLYISLNKSSKNGHQVKY